MSKSIAAASAIALTLAASPALALTFDFTGSPGDLGSDNTFSLAGVSGSVTASRDGVLGPVGARVSNTQDGLGVGWFLDPSQGEVNGPVNETIKFQFDAPVDLDYVEFGKFVPKVVFGFSSGDDNSIHVDGEVVESENRENPFYFGDKGAGATWFSVTANGLTDSFTVEKIGVTEIAAVPTPAALPLVLTGAAFFGWAARRKRA